MENHILWVAAQVAHKEHQQEILSGEQGIHTLAVNQDNSD